MLIPLPPLVHVGAPLSTVERAIETDGLMLMERPTVDVEQMLAAERMAWLDAHPLARKVVRGSS